MENKGIVKKIEGNNLYIELFRDSSCAHCSGCGKADKTIKDLYKYKLTEEDIASNIEIKEGHMVTFEINNKFILNLALLIYISPVFLMIVGYLVAAKFGATEGQGILVSFITLVVSFCGFYFYDRKAGKERVSEEISIKNVIEEENITMTSCGTKS